MEKRRAAVTPLKKMKHFSPSENPDAEFWPLHTVASINAEKRAALFRQMQTYKKKAEELSALIQEKLGNPDAASGLFQCTEHIDRISELEQKIQKLESARAHMHPQKDPKDNASEMSAPEEDPQKEAAVTLQDVLEVSARVEDLETRIGLCSAKHSPNYAPAFRALEHEAKEAAALNSKLILDIKSALDLQESLQLQIRGKEALLGKTRGDLDAEKSLRIETIDAFMACKKSFEKRTSELHELLERTNMHLAGYARDVEKENIDGSKATINTVHVDAPGIDSKDSSGDPPAASDPFSDAPSTLGSLQVEAASKLHRPQKSAECSSPECRERIFGLEEREIDRVEEVSYLLRKYTELSRMHDELLAASHKTPSQHREGRDSDKSFSQTDSEKDRERRAREEEILAERARLQTELEKIKLDYIERKSSAQYHKRKALQMEAENKAMHRTIQDLEKSNTSLHGRLKKEKEKEAQSSKSSAAGKSLQLYQKMVRCSVCCTRIKDTVLKKCMHLLCRPCVDGRYTTRQRTCPICGVTFALGDVSQVYL